MELTVQRGLLKWGERSAVMGATPCDEQLASKPDMDPTD